MVINKHNIHQFIDGKEMDCSYEGITSIEYIPEGITHLYCYNNQLTQLPKLPNSLKRLDCRNNKLTDLPYLPDSLIELYCVNNKLTSSPKHSIDQQWWINHNNRLKIINRSNIIKKLLSK